MAEPSDMFELGRICERLAKSREIVYRRMDYADAVKLLAAKSAPDITESTRKIIAKIGLEGQKDGMSFIYAGVFYNYARSGWKALREVLLIEEPQRRILAQRGIPGEVDLIRVTTTNPVSERTKTISSLVGVEKRLDDMLSGKVTIDV